MGHVGVVAAGELCKEYVSIEAFFTHLLNWGLEENAIN